MRKVALITLLWAAVAACSGAETPLSGLEALNHQPFFYGREYFILRSGRAQMVLQADRADLGPAFTYLLFDAQNAAQSRRKDGAFNYGKNTGFSSSALEVVLGNFAFTALGHRTDTRWVSRDGIPVVQAVWWAGGVRVTETLSALADVQVFQRDIRLDGAHLLGEEKVMLQLYLPPGGDCVVQNPLLVRIADSATLALGVAPPALVRLEPEHHRIKIGPVGIQPGQSQEIHTFLGVNIPKSNSPTALWPPTAVVTNNAVRAHAVTRMRWAQSSSLQTADLAVQDMFDKTRFVLPGMIADDGTIDAGIFEYGAQWVRDTSNTALGALHAGHFELARACLERMLTKMVSTEGVTMIANSFDTPDREQFDQMGELMHLLKAYRDWTGDDSLIRQHRQLLVTMVERPLDLRFRDDTGMVHNRREFWERTFTDAYELAYQTYVILGLREAIALADALSAQDHVEHWRHEADKIQAAVLTHPTRALVQDGHLIKRRLVNGEVANRLANFAGYQPDVPLNTETHHQLFPDASVALPIALGIVEGPTDLARRTLDDLEQLWNTRWSDGGYDRYHTSAQPDQPGPWPFATCFILRAQHEAGLWDRSRRSFEWLNNVQGGRTGCWFEEIPSIRSLNQGCGIVCWTSAEVALFIVRHYLGVCFEGSQLIIRPALYPGSPSVSADLRFRQGRLRLHIDGSGPAVSAQVNDKNVMARPDGAIVLPPEFLSGTVVIHTRNGTTK